MAETYSVLTRLPGDARVAAEDAARLLEANFDKLLAPRRSTLVNLPALLAPLRITGGAVYDALVALAAQQARVPLLTRDGRAVGTYATIGAEVQIPTA